MRLTSLAAVMLGLTACRAEPPAPKAAPPANWVWWEGEEPEATNFPARSWFSADTFPENADLLSGSAWLSNSGDRTGDEAFARYTVTVPAAATYHFWTRKFWQHGPFRWRFDEADWRVCGRNVSLADSVELKLHTPANWVYLGDVELAAGRHTFELRLLAGPGEGLTAAFDCFLLTTGPFTPRGKLKPGERSGLADPGYFAWEPADDPFGDEAAFDLRGLNEAVAGQSGPVRRDGLGIALGDGTPARFWAVNIGSNQVTGDHASLDYMARKLAKFGVNLVRFHSPIFGTGDDFSALNERVLDGLHYLVHALKQQGVYTTVSVYFPLWSSVRPSWGLTGFETIQNDKPFGLIFFDPRFQLHYRTGLERQLTAPNPYTGLSLAEDPAVASVEICNEDSLFFWTFNRQNIPGPYWDMLAGGFGLWLKAKYGSVTAAIEAWGGFTVEGDNPAADRAAVLPAWDMTAEGSRQGPAGKVRRMGDQVHYLTELQRRFYDETTAQIRGWGFRGLVSASNWTVADPVTLDALERYTYTAGDLIDRHGYFEGRHEGEAASYSVRVGHQFGSLSALTVPERVPIQVVQVDGWPHCISEIGWPQPNRLRADATLLGSAYGSLQGIDAIYWFALGATSLADQSMGKFQLCEPLGVGSFPATALLYRRGDVTESESVIHQVVRLDDLYAMQGSGAVSDRALDALRAADIPPGGELTGAVTQLDPLSFYVGRVTREFGDDPTRSRQRDLSQYINRQQRVVHSFTGELALQYGDGLMTVNTARTQAAAGFLGAAGRITLGDVEIECGNEYGQVVVTSLDGAPLFDAARILIQVLTRAQPYGFTTEGETITALGGGPFGVERIEGSVALTTAGEITARVLDENGYPTGATAPVTRRGEQRVITLPAEAIYLLVER